MFDACHYGVPVWRLQELVSTEVRKMEIKRSQSSSSQGFEDMGGQHLDIFEQFCQGVNSGYVMETSHPYSSVDEIDQCLEVAMDDPVVAGVAGSQSGGWGICIAFDPRSDTRAGDGHISFLVEDQQQQQNLKHIRGDSSIHDIKAVSLLFRPRGLELNLAQKSSQDDDTIEPDSVWPDEEVNLPGVNGCPPLFLPTNRFIIR